jgi:acyl-CoA thioesterase-2
MMQLSAREPDSFVGTGPQYPWGGLYGGQIVAQSLWAAAATVDPSFRVHSLHAYFIRRGDATEPIRFDVDRLRNGRSFMTRSVVARQSNGVILQMSASFNAGGAERFQASPFPAVESPDSVADSSWSPMFDRRYLSETKGQSLAWMRTGDLDPEDPVLAACGLAYLSDDLPAEVVQSEQQEHGGTDEGLIGTSLDHAIWFHQPFAGNAWQLHDVRCQGLGHPRGLAVGQVYSADGVHLATVAQEVLLRRRESL